MDDGPLGDVGLELDQPRLLRLAAFLHDIGKGHGGEHAKVGAEIASRVRRADRARRQDHRPPGQRGEASSPPSADRDRRDLADPAVIDEVASEIGSLQLLQVLYLLTIADSRATGPSMWNDWKASLLRTLFLRCAARFGVEEPAITTAGATRQEVLARSVGAMDAMAAHLDAMPDDYLRSLGGRRRCLASRAGHRSGWCVQPWGFGGEPIETVVVVGPSIPGFRRTVAAVFAANGCRCRGDCSADPTAVVDSFRVRDDRTGGIVPDGAVGQGSPRCRSRSSGGARYRQQGRNRAAAYPFPDLSRPRPSARTPRRSRNG